MTVILATQEETEFWFEANLGQKVSETLFQKINWVWWYTSVIPIMQEAKVGGWWFEASPRQKHKTLPEK
jgi:hypothetical protein